MPLPNKSVGGNIRELHGGKTYKATSHKYGKSKANKQAIAIAFDAIRRAKAKR